jgi:hypothetical protein
MAPWEAIRNLPLLNALMGSANSQNPSERTASPMDRKSERMYGVPRGGPASAVNKTKASQFSLSVC